MADLHNTYTTLRHPLQHCISTVLVQCWHLMEMQTF